MIKKYIFIFIIFCSSNLSSYAQDYVPILYEGSFWDTEEIGSGCIYIQRLAIDKDTIINNVQYKSLKSLYFRDSNGNNSCISPPYEAYGSDFQTFPGAFIRENISEKRLYLYVEDFNGAPGEFVLADFTLEEGEQMTNAYGNAMGVNELIILADGRKQYHMGDGTIITEGIGKENGQLRPFGIIGDGATYSYHCHGNDTNHNGCLVTLGVRDEQLAQIKVFPNPTSEKISFTNLENNTFKLYSIAGKELSIQFSEQNQEIDISHLNQGIYFLEIRGSQNSKRIIKLVKN